ncbi:hypothetical protein D3C77_300960 [compost metagenome]
MPRCIGLVEEDVRIGHDVLRLECKGHEIPKAGTAFEAVANVLIKAHVRQARQPVEHVLYAVAVRVLALNLSGDAELITFKDEHIISRLLLPRFWPGKQLETLVGVDKQPKPCTRIANGAYGNRTLFRCQTVIDDGDNG